MHRSRPTRAVLLTTIAFGVAGLLAAACGSSDGAVETDTTTTVAASHSLVGAWTLSTYATDGEPVPAATPPATIDFLDDGTFSGTTGCNGLSGTWAGDVDGPLTITPGPMTQMACSDPDGQAQEQALVAGLPEVAANEVMGTTLTLSDDAGAAILTWERGHDGLVGAYVVTGVNNGNGAVVSSAATEAAAITFAADGTVSGTTGCNSFSGPYETDGSTLTIDGQLAMTTMACEGEAQQVEQQFLAALQASTTWERSGQLVTLRDASGATQLTLTPA